MKALKCLFVLSAFFGLLFIGCSEKSSPVASPTDQAINSSSGYISLGKVTTIAFTATEEAASVEYGRFVGRGNRIVAKDVVFYAPWTTEEPRVSGVGVYTFNASFNAAGEGPMQGKFTMEVGGGTWKGTVEGKMFMAPDGSELLGIFSYVAHGKGGTIDGMKLTCTETYHEALDYSYAYGDIVGDIR